MRPNEFTTEVAARIATGESLEQLYERIVERSTFSPTVHQIRDYALRAGWSLSRTLAAMVFMLMVQEEATREEINMAWLQRPQTITIPIPKDQLMTPKDKP